MVYPRPLDFGEREGGETTDQVLSLLNPGTAALTISDLMLNGPTAFELVEPREDVTLGTDKIHEVSLRFTAPGGALTGQLTVHSDDPAWPEYPVDLVGNGLLPELQVTVGETAPLSPGCEDEVDVTLENVVRAPLQVDGLVVTGSGLTLQDAPTLPFVLDPGEGWTSPLALAPGLEDDLSGELEFATNEPTGAHNIPLGFETQDGGRLQVDKEQFQLGAQELGCSQVVKLPIRNRGTCRLALDVVSDAENLIVEDPLSPLAALAPGEEMQVRALWTTWPSTTRASRCSHPGDP